LSRAPERGDLMTKVTFVEFSGVAHEIEASNEGSLMQAAVGHGVPGIIADCGGALSCATCHVYVRPEFAHLLESPTPEEEAMVEMAIEPSSRSRLSCCLKIRPELEGLILDIPQRQI
jgi:2Fe-2S ferredoxin